MNKFKFRYVILIFGIIIFTNFNSCDFNKISNPGDEIEIRIKNIARETLVNVEFLDAASGNQIKNPIKLNFFGADNEKVITTVNEPIISTQTVEEGMFIFAIQDGILPSQSNPVKLTLMCNAEGYLSTSKPIKITHDGTSNYTIMMTNLTDTPQGVATNSEKKGNTNAEGETTEEIQVSSGEESETGAQASITVGQGTTLLDGDGNALSGDVQTQVTYFNPQNEQSLAAFPGGFTVTTQNAGNQEEGVFETAGFVAVDMNVNNTPVEQFEGNVQVSIDIPQGTINPETDEAVKPGDIIPIYSYDEDNGEWHFEGNVTIPDDYSGLAKVSNGNYRVTINNITHLSYWNLDWFDTKDYCDYGTTLRFVPESGSFSAIKAVIVDANTEQPVSWWSDKVIYPTDAVKTLQYAPNNTPVIVKVYEFISWWQEGDLVGEKRVENLCAYGDTTDIVFQSNQMTVQIELIVRCDNSRVNLNGYPLWARKQGGNWANLGTLVDGQVSVAFDRNERYEFAVYHDGQWYYASNYANAIEEFAAESGTNLDVNQNGVLISENLTSFTIILDNIDEICNQF